MQGAPLPQTPDAGSHERVITEWYDDYDGNEVTMRSMVRDGYLVTAYAPTNQYDGSEGELYALADDPQQWRNLWDDPAMAGVKADLLADMRDNVPEGRADPLERVALV